MPFREDHSPRPENAVDPSHRVTYTGCGVGVPLKSKSLRAHFNPLVVGFGIVSPFLAVPNMSAPNMNDQNDQPIFNHQAAETPSGKNLEGRR
jgi:hypothetical protein